MVIQVLVALLLGIGDFSVPSPILHDSLGSENSLFVVVMTVDALRVFHQVAVFDVPPPITITDTGNIPGGVADGTGYELADFYGFWHIDLLSNEKWATCRDDRPPLIRIMS
jgi:hypothetical protein